MVAMSYSRALEVKNDWDKTYFVGRTKTREVLQAEEVIAANTTKKPSEDKHRIQRKMRLQYQKFENLSKEFEMDGDLNTKDKAYVIGLVNELKGFFLKYKKKGNR